MVKKVILLDKVNKHPYYGETVFFATQHGKEDAVSPALSSTGLRCEPLAINTDQFGTFSGEIQRQGSVRETLRLKIATAAQINPTARLVLASEGSFGPHPFIGFIQSDHEALMLYDRKLNIEIYAEELSHETNHAEIIFSPRDDLNSFIKQIGFPEHGLIVASKGASNVIYKDLATIHDVQQAILNALMSSPEGKAILSTDMRAHRNPTRMKIIEKAGAKLVEMILSLCPACSTPGFSIKNINVGLPCEECGQPSQRTKNVIWACLDCNYNEIKPRPDGLTLLSAAECDNCNP